jgi:hypothetical protein
VIRPDLDPVHPSTSPSDPRELAQTGRRVRKDVYGYDALARAQLANDRPAEADDDMTSALALDDSFDPAGAQRARTTPERLS